MEEMLKKCPICGRDAKVRYKLPYTWVECKRKCTKTGYFVDWDEQCDPEARRKAIAEWNAIPRKE